MILPQIAVKYCHSNYKRTMIVTDDGFKAVTNSEAQMVSHRWVEYSLGYKKAPDMNASNSLYYLTPFNFPIPYKNY